MRTDNVITKTGLLEKGTETEHPNSFLSLELEIFQVGDKGVADLGGFKSKSNICHLETSFIAAVEAGSFEFKTEDGLFLKEFDH